MGNGIWPQFHDSCGSSGSTSVDLGLSNHIMCLGIWDQSP